MLKLFKRHKALYTDGEIELVLAGTGQADALSGISDGFTFDIYRAGGGRRMGYISLRLGESPELYYLGHVGYRVDDKYRGKGYALKALNLLKPLMAQEGLLHPVITTNPDNMPSRRTCEKAGGVLERTVPVPPRYRALCMGAEEKCRYILTLAPTKEDNTP